MKTTNKLNFLSFILLEVLLFFSRTAGIKFSHKPAVYNVGEKDFILRQVITKKVKVY